MAKPTYGTIRTWDPQAVSQTGAGENPLSSGLGAAVVEGIWSRVHKLYRTRLQPAIALAIYHHGHLILDRTVGHTRGNAPGDLPGSEELAAPDSLFNLFSASKAVTAMLIHHLDAQNFLRLDDPVAEYIPEFSQHGKGDITLRHILTHRAGIPMLRPEDANLDVLTDPEEIVARLCDLKPSFPAGRRLAYHTITGGFVLGEIVKRITGKDIRHYLQETVTTPLGLRDFNYGVAPGQADQVALNAMTGKRPAAPVRPLIKRALGVTLEEACDISNNPRFLTAIIPAGNLITTAREAAGFYNMMLHDGQHCGQQIFSPRTIRRARQRQTYWELDLTLGIPVTYGLGFMLGRPHFGFYGPHTENAFGHLGLINILTYADPDRDIAVALITTGKPFVTWKMWWWYDIVRQIALTIPRNR